jgi:hypothetical protein
MTSPGTKLLIIKMRGQHGSAKTEFLHAVARLARGFGMRTELGKNLTGWQRVALVDEDFPRWEGIPAKVARTRGGAAQTLNPKYVAEFMRAARDLSRARDLRREKFACVTLVTGKSNTDPLLLLFPDAPHAFALIMPVKVKIGGALPGFMKRVLRRARAK